MIRLGRSARRSLAPSLLDRGFTLIELMITLTVLAAVMLILLVIMKAAARSKTETGNQIEASQAARVALDMMSRDLRSAGYHADLDYLAAPQPPIAYIDSMQVLINADFQPGTGDTVPQPPLAYNPAGNPRPYPLNGTIWQPPIKYRRGAELVRWTLDVNNDGVVNSADIASANGVEAQHTPNPNDYVLVRQTYGDSTGSLPGFNGGQMDHVALLRKPGGTVPPMFQVYLNGSTTPWDWSNGPIPPTKLSSIAKIQIQVDAPAAKPDKNGVFQESVMRTEVNSIRNVPSFGNTEYPIDGYVRNDLNMDGTPGSTEPGLANATVRCGAYSASTAANGYYLFRVRAGTYTLRNIPPPGYGVSSHPDSAVVSVGPATNLSASASFADTAIAGGWVSALAFNDQNGNSIQDAGEPPLQNVQMSMSGGQMGFTDASGNVQLFARAGSYSVTCTPPDSFMCTTGNPYTGIMMNGGSASIAFGLTKTPTGSVSGSVYRDNNRDGVKNAGEPGIANVWVGVTNDGGVTIQGYQYTDASGNYSFMVPANQPPGTKPYSIIVIVPPGFFPTTTTAIAPVWVTNGSSANNNNFGMSSYQVISLNASRVLSLASGDLLEKQGGDNGGSGARQDADIVLGADAGGTDNVSVWFNQYDTTPLFNSNPDYTRNAPQSVMSIALDTLDTDPPKARLDLVTGTKTSPAGNFFVWFSQNSGGNTGTFPTSFSTAYRTTDNGDVQAVKTLDCAGASAKDQVDIIVGTKSPTAGQGTIEIWQSNNAVTPTYTRLETYPTSGGIPGNTLGEVSALALADINGDGKKDLIVGTKTGNYTGQLMIFRNNGKSAGTSRFTFAQSVPITGSVTCIAATKVDADTLIDLIVGVQTGFGAGELQEIHNATLAGIINFIFSRRYTAPGIPLSVIAADLGGIAGKDDIAMGWRADETSYVGGIRVLSLDLNRLPLTDTDPSNGSITNMVPALTSSNFNYGVQPALPAPPYLPDVAAGIKVSATTGALVVFIR
jgi:prepilin-type N-terminal cleavage/methylation domain-containing protein